MVKGKVFFLTASSLITNDTAIYFNLACRQTAMVPFNATIGVKPVKKEQLQVLEQVKFEVKGFAGMKISLKWPKGFSTNTLETRIPLES